MANRGGGSDLECAGQNVFFLQKLSSTWKKVIALKVEVEELESLLGTEDWKWILCEFWKKRGTNKVARSLRLSAQRARVNSWQSAERVQEQQILRSLCIGSKSGWQSHLTNL